jgi:hypothetical protein
VTKSWRGLDISLLLCVAHALSIPSILNSMVVVFLHGQPFQLRDKEITSVIYPVPLRPRT